MRFILAALGLTAALFAQAARADVPKHQVERTIEGARFDAVASYYCCYFNGRRAADGSRFNQDASTAAHKRLPFGTLLLVTNPVTGLSETVRITDRGPFIAGRDLDLSRGTARRIGLEKRGVGRVIVQVLR